MMKHRKVAVAIGATVLLAAMAVVIRLDQTAPIDPAGVRVIDAANHVGAPVPVVRSGRTETISTPPVDPMLDEAPESLKALHLTADAAAPDRDTAGERRVTDVFRGASDFWASPVTVLCTPRRCEVHGTTTTDEVETRLAIRNAPFLDKIATAGYSSGTDMVRRTANGSEFIVYMEPRD